MRGGVKGAERSAFVRDGPGWRVSQHPRLPYLFLDIIRDYYSPAEVREILAALVEWIASVEEGRSDD